MLLKWWRRIIGKETTYGSAECCNCPRACPLAIASGMRGINSPMPLGGLTAKNSKNSQERQSKVNNENPQNQSSQMTVPHPVTVLPERRSGTDKIVMGGYRLDMTRSEKVAFYNMLVGDSGKLDEIKDKPMNLNACVVAETEWADDNGELRPGHKVWLISDEGDSYFCGSSGIASSLFALEVIFGSPPWSPSLVVTVMEKQTAGRNRYYYLQLAEDPRESEPARKPKKDK